MKARLWLGVRPWALGLAVFGMAVLGVTAPAAGSAWAADDGKTTFTVAPANESGRDGRHGFDLVLDPGQQVTEHVAVTNLSGKQVTFDLVASDGYFTQSGRFAMVPNPQDSTEAGTWIDIQPTVEVGPRETVVVPFMVKVPPGAEPGDHAAAVAVGVSRRAQAEGADSGLAVTSRMGLKVLTRVAGELSPGLEVANVKTVFSQSWNPFEPGRMNVAFDLTNTGNVRVTATGTVEVAGASVVWPSESANKVELMPGESRRVETSHRGVWPWFRVAAAIRVTPMAAPTTAGAQAPDMAPLEAAVDTLALPLPQFFCLLAIGLIAGSLVAARRGAKKRLQATVAEAAAKAREQGRAEALAASEQSPNPQDPDPEAQ